MCAQIAPADVYLTNNFLPNAGQIAEIQAMLALCPTHPLAAQYTAAIARTQVVDGRDFNGGVMVVGQDVQPGTYASENVEGCYWERQDKNGRTLANDFVTAAARVQVTIEASDFGFYSEGCGHWLPVG